MATILENHLYSSLDCHVIHDFVENSNATNDTKYQFHALVKNHIYLIVASSELLTAFFFICSLDVYEGGKKSGTRFG